MTTTIKLIGEYPINFSSDDEENFVDKYNKVHYISNYVKVDSVWCDRKDLKELGILAVDTTSHSNYGIRLNKSFDGVYLFELHREEL